MLKSIKSSINWKLYGVLLLITTISLILGLPYVAGLQGDQLTFSLFFRYIGASGLITALALYVGLLLGKKINLDIPILRTYITGDKLPKVKIKSLKGFAPLMGLLFGLAIYAIDLLFAPFLKGFFCLHCYIRLSICMVENNSEYFLWWILCGSTDALICFNLLCLGFNLDNCQIQKRGS